MVHIDFSSIRETRWYEYASRFLFGGLITAATGIVAKKFGPGIAGLFLAFPAIFPASATLLEKHTEEKKRQKGFDGRRRARGAASLDAAGAAVGSAGLMGFALLGWRLLPKGKPYLALFLATVAWFALAVGAWELRRLRHRFNH